jgi:ERF superfamily
MGQELPKIEPIKEMPRALTAPEFTQQALTPLEMLNRAIEKGADIDLLEKLMALHDRWQANQQRKEFDEALANAKAEIMPVVKNRDGHNNKKYADFSAVTKAVDPVLAKHGVRYRFRTQQDDKIHVTCILHHRAGHYEENTLAGPPDQTGNKNAIQAIGSTLTYLQRYSLMQALGLAAADDDDGRASGNNAPLTAEQIDKITALISETKSDIGRFLKWAGAESVNDITQARFNDCVALLEAKKSKKAAP